MYQYAVRRQERALNKPDGVKSIADQFFEAQTNERRAKEIDRLSKSGLEEFAKKSKEMMADSVRENVGISNVAEIRRAIGASIVDPFAVDDMVVPVAPVFSGALPLNVGGDVKQFNDLLPGTGLGQPRRPGVGTDFLTDTVYQGDDEIAKMVELLSGTRNPSELYVGPSVSSRFTTDPSVGPSVLRETPEVPTTLTALPKKSSKAYYTEFLESQGVPLQEYTGFTLDKLKSLAEDRFKESLQAKEIEIARLRKQRSSEKGKISRKRVGVTGVSDEDEVRRVVGLQF
jgi:hypothetical protein